MKNIETNCNRLVSGYKKIVLGFDAVTKQTKRNRIELQGSITNSFSFIPLGLGAKYEFWTSIVWSIKRMSNFLSLSKTPSVVAAFKLSR